MLTGSLKMFSFINLIQMCYNDNTTGTIRFTKNDVTYASIGFINGALTHAQFTENAGIKAVKQLTLLQDLDFNLILDIPQTKPNIKTDINFLLLECSRHMDECVEYIGQLTRLFEKKFSLIKAQLYQYRHVHFAFPDVYPVKYFEVYDQTQMTVIYYDKKIGSMVELLFDNRILTNDLLIFMGEKDIFE